MKLAPSALALLLVAMIAAGCASRISASRPGGAREQTNPIVAVTEVSPLTHDTDFAIAEVLSLTRDIDSPFRFYGEARIIRPSHYAGLEVQCFFLSHDRDLRTLVGHRVGIDADTDGLNRQLEPNDPFSVNHTPMLGVEDIGGRLRAIDDARHQTPVSVVSHIADYNSNNGSMYFVFDVLYSGDMATVVVDSPVRYRGTKLNVLVEEKNAHRPDWAGIGKTVAFTTPEVTLDWEPWGFTRAFELKDVSFGTQPR